MLKVTKFYLVARYVGFFFVLSSFLFGFYFGPGVFTFDLVSSLFIFVSVVRFQSYKSIANVAQFPFCVVL